MAGRYYQTTPIYYVNDAPHLGTAYSIICADALSRWHRLLGDETWFLTGTDEHGLKIVRAAQEQSLSPLAWADITSARFVRAWEALELTNDDFIRTTEQRHHQSMQCFMQAIYDNGFLYKGTYEGWYCVSCEAYYAEDDLVTDHLCPVHERPVEWFTEENWFFALSRFTEPLLEWYESNPGVVYPDIRRNEALGIIRGGLRDISVTRTSIDWGIPVPWDPSHVFYVWFDALVNYVSAIGFGQDEERFDTWWPAAHHLLGKDILRFHCVWWPAMCMAAGIAPPAQLLVHGFLLVGGKKMAKTGFDQVDPAGLAAEVGNDALRYYLVRDFPIGSDGEFSYEGLIERYNADLANNLGNLFARVAAVVSSKCGGQAPAPQQAGASRLAPIATEGVAAAVEAWERFAPHDALEATWRIIRAANAELETVAPWKLDPGPAVDAVLGDCLEILRLVAVLVAAVLPATAVELWERLGLDGTPHAAGIASPSGGLAWGGFPGGTTVSKGAPLFPRRTAE
jgi:methionyl-tRNA synthetase